MTYFLVKVSLTALIVAAVSELARRQPAAGALLASLPLVSILGVIWLWRDTEDVKLVAAHLEATFWFVLPSLPAFLIVPALLRSGWAFWPALFAGIALTLALYLGGIGVWRWMRGAP
jgi:hypothetical protein